MGFENAAVLGRERPAQRHYRHAAS